MELLAALHGLGRHLARRTLFHSLLHTGGWVLVVVVIVVILVASAWWRRRH